MRYQDINAQSIDGWCREGWQWARPSPTKPTPPPGRGNGTST